MFTGIISEIGEVKKVFRDKENTVFTIAAKKNSKGFKLGDSIAINGSCHTVIQKVAGEFKVESMPETLRRTNLGELKAGSKVNLEKPLRFNGSIDGHFVSGHIDGVAKILSITPDKNSKLFTLEIPKALSKFVVEKGSIALDGISLTVIAIRGNRVTVGIIPHTLKFTTLGLRKVGDKINVEVDLLAKHLAKLVSKN